jgi:serine/threonine protein phosphatase PrpC
MSTYEVENRQNKTLKNLEKELERKSREPSKRLGKNAKKRAARREKILAEEVENYDLEQGPIEEIGIKPPRIPLSRIKRKLGHRERRPEVPEFEDKDVDEIIEFSEIECSYEVIPPPPPKIKINLDASIKQLCKKQDFVVYSTIENKEGVTKEDGDLPIVVLAVMDGHGSDIVPKIIRELDIENHFQKLDTPSSIQESILASCKKMKEESDNLEFIPGKMKYSNYYLKKQILNNHLETSGTTYSAAYLHRNEKTGILKIVSEWVGDSPIFIFVNGELVFKSSGHHTNNEKEVELMIQKGFISGVENGGGGFELISEDEIISKSGKYTISRVPLACTRSLGHNGLVCTEADRVTITAKMTDEVSIIVCSDGVGDMLHMDYDIEKLKTYSAVQLVDFAEKRWKQVWKYKGKTTTFPSNGYDDCCAAVWCQKK